MTQFRRYIRTKLVVAMFLTRLVRFVLIYLWCRAIQASKAALYDAIQYMGSRGARDDLRAVAQGVIGGSIYTALTTQWDATILIPFVVGYAMLRVARESDAE